MADLFTDESERLAIVADVAARLGVAEWVVEKDLWVCWALARVCQIPGLPGVAFKGGTSLSKVHGLVDRFSEDIDLTFSRAGWGFEGERDPLRPDLSAKRRQGLVDEIADRSTAVVRELVVPGFVAACERSLGPSGWSVEVAPEDAQAVHFRYPKPGSVYGYGQPVVKLEFGARGEPWPSAVRPVRPYVEEVHAGLATAAVTEVATLDPMRTFWEKATLMHALHHGTLTKPDKRMERLSRHMYDLHRMWGRPELREAILGDRELLVAVVRNKTVFFEEAKARYELVEAFTLDASPHVELEARLRQDYEAMAEMFFPGTDVPTFDALLDTLRAVDAAVAAWKPG